eukprot:scaffold23454_cov99-Cylindrotheca_fusiformis.AAC.1
MHTPLLKRASSDMAANDLVKSCKEETKMVEDSPSAAASITTTPAANNCTQQAASSKSSTEWDLKTLQTFLSNNMPEGFNAGVIAKKLLLGGYTTKCLLLGAKREGLERQDLKSAEIDSIIKLQKKPESAIVQPSVWQALGPFLCDQKIPSLAVMEEKVNKQGTKRKVFELDMETKTASRDGTKERRIWEARHKPVAVPASGTRWYQGMTEKAELFTRECTMDCFQIMWNTFEEEKQAWIKEDIERCIAFIVTGPPGLGKS